MKKLFGTDGMRGEAGVFPLDQKTIEVVGFALAKLYTESLGRIPRFVTGRDTRESGSWIENAFHKGAVSAGAHCESAEVITTPGVAFVTREFDFDAGIVISASHNPFQDNGLKVFLPTGRKLEESVEREIERYIYDKTDLNSVGMANQIDIRRSAEFRQAYLAYLCAGFQNLQLSGKRIVVDCANGASSTLAPELFSSFGAEVIPIHNTPDGKNINLDCGSTHIESLIKKVVEESADLGVAFDGDADRALFVDENGELVDGDATLWAMAQLLKAHGGLKDDVVVATVMSNLGLEVALESIGVKLLRTAVGDKYVLQELLTTGTSVGGEQSGHIIFPAKSLVGDGMMTALFLLEVMFEKKRTLSQLTDGFVRYPQILINVKVGEKKPFDEVPAIVNAVQGVETELGSSGRLLLRYSGTENLARVMIEGKDQATIEKQAHSVADVIKASLGNPN